jgi:DNA polymerase-3 subunit beta
MKFTILREELLKPLQLVTGIVEKKQTLPILSNVLLRADQNLSIIATDLEVELIINLPFRQGDVIPGQITVPARKLVDICRSLPEQASIDFTLLKDKLSIQSGRSKFSLATLPAEEYPNLEETENLLDFTIEQKNLRFLLERTHFSMAQQDVRYYLNGMLLEVKQGIIRSVATDGHRLALNSIDAAAINNACASVIIPRKGVIEMLRLLEDSTEEITVSIMDNHIRIAKQSLTFTSKLIDGRFPDYERVLPKGGDKIILVDREQFKQSLTRASILSNEKLRGIKLQLRNGLLRVLANNPDREEAEEELSTDYTGADLDIGFNEKYLRDILDAMGDPQVFLILSDSNSSILVEGAKRDGSSLFVVMPMRL